VFGFGGGGVEVDVDVVRRGLDGNVGSFERVVEAQRQANESLIMRRLVVVGYLEA